MSQDEIYWVMVYMPSRGHQVVVWNLTSNLRNTLHQYFDTWGVVYLERIGADDGREVWQVDMDNRDRMTVDCYHYPTEQLCFNAIAGFNRAISVPAVYFEEREGEFIIRVLNGKAFLIDTGANEKRSIGRYDEHGNFVKGDVNPLDPKKHKVRKHDGWGINAAILEHMHDERLVYIVTMERRLHLAAGRIKALATPEKLSPESERQYIVPESLWVVDEK